MCQVVNIKEALRGKHSNLFVDQSVIKDKRQNNKLLYL